MGVISKLFGSSSPEVQDVSPSPTTVTSHDTELDTASSKKKRRGISSTILSSDHGTIAGSSSGTGRSTLG